VHVPPRITDWGFRILNTFHHTVMRVSGGRLGSRAYGLDMVELVTTGRRSGRAHSTMLLVPLRDGSDLVLVASKGGDLRDPDWFKNLVANPLVRVTMRGMSAEMLARVATPEEHAILWPRTVARYRHYEGYQRRAGRLIPLVICTPRDHET
jgi:deazaflavin-dependent oxidoreductase (nitroreductase family)